MKDIPYYIETPDMHEPPLSIEGRGFVWTKEPPTIDGWYWAMRLGVPEMVSVELPLVWWPVGGDPMIRLSEFSHWLGPIPFPEPPTE